MTDGGNKMSSVVASQSVSQSVSQAELRSVVVMEKCEHFPRISDSK